MTIYYAEWKCCKGKGLNPFRAEKCRKKGCRHFTPGCTKCKDMDVKFYLKPKGKKRRGESKRQDRSDTDTSSTVSSAATMSNGLDERSYVSNNNMGENRGPQPKKHREDARKGRSAEKRRDGKTVNARNSHSRVKRDERSGTEVDCSSSIAEGDVPDGHHPGSRHLDLEAMAEDRRRHAAAIEELRRGAAARGIQLP